MYQISLGLIIFILCVEVGCSSKSRRFGRGFRELKRFEPLLRNFEPWSSRRISKKCFTYFMLSLETFQAFARM